MSNITIALDAGHGGSDLGATYNNRQEKDDVLRLTRAVGNILEKRGINVFYVREDDEYETPFKKATDANNIDADFFISIHRNSSESPNQYSGVETLVYEDSGIRSALARNINNELEQIGFNNLGVTERKNLVVLRRTKMPAVLVEAGFINTDSDNELFDNSFNEIAQAIANGILDTIQDETQKTSVEHINGYHENNMYNALDNNSVNDMYNTPNNNSVNDMYNTPNNSSVNDMYSTDNINNMYNINNTGSESSDRCFCDSIDDKLYRIQVGSFKDKENADRMLNSLLAEGFPAFIIYDNGYYKVQVGAFVYLTNAIKMEQRLRRFRYNTYIVYD